MNIRSGHTCITITRVAAAGLTVALMKVQGGSIIKANCQTWSCNFIPTARTRGDGKLTPEFAAKTYFKPHRKWQQEKERKYRLDIWLDYLIKLVVHTVFWTIVVVTKAERNQFEFRFYFYFKLNVSGYCTLVRENQLSAVVIQLEIMISFSLISTAAAW